MELDEEITLADYLMLENDWHICQSCQKEYYGPEIKNFSICPKCHSFDEENRRISNETPFIYRRVGYRKEKIPNELRWDVWERDNFTCQKCGSRRNLTVDHIYPEKLGGKATMENCQTLCRSCNSAKGTK